MHNLKIWMLSLMGIFLFANVQANVDPTKNPGLRTSENDQNQVRYRSDCDQATSQIDQSINNVRARLLTGGDVWWDGGDGRYVVPKVPAGVPEVSAIFAGAVWLGGIDPGGNLKLAAQQYGSGSGNSDFWPGPLDPVTGTTEQATCSNWDRFFVVYGEEIDDHIRKYQRAEDENRDYTESEIPRNIRGWPGRGNPFFFDVHQFELPNTSQGLAGFFDNNSDGIYDPTDGDYPVIEVRGCPDPQYPDEMFFWIYNDNGNIHSESNADPIQMEVQVQSFAYATNDELNDMTFQRYKLINRAIESIDSTYFAMWVDADLGCHTDDYVGCDTIRSLGYYYNADALDGQTGCNCPGGVNTYCDQVPILGIDYFRGPLDEEGRELGMSAFTYFNNGGIGNPPNGTTDPNSAQEYYNYLTGAWRTGERFTFGDDAYQDGAPVNYAFPDAPTDQEGWSMCTHPNNTEYDRRTIQASGPFRLDPGAVNELIIGAVWVADQDYPCPSIRTLQAADDIAQALFDNCFEITDGPDAPDLDFLELDREIIVVLTNDEDVSNNAFEAYAEKGLTIPSIPGIDSLYRFEGYRIFQLSGPDVTVADFDDPDKARIVAQVDIQNGVREVYNWVLADSPLDDPFYMPVLQNESATNSGIRHTFRITEDQFASGDRTLVNHKKYYYTALAYAYNNYEDYDPNTGVGQRLPFLEGRRNIGDGTNPYYTVIPRPIVDRSLNSEYGGGAVITRLDGVGAGGNFLDMSETTINSILNNEFTGEIIYKPGSGPIDVQVYNPLEVRDGEFLLTFVDDNLNDDQLDKNATWRLTNLSDPNAAVITSDGTIEKLNEQILSAFGITLSIGQTADAGDKLDENNGVIGYDEVYADGNAWFTGIRDEDIYDDVFPGFGGLDAVLDFVKTRSGEADEILDPTQAFTTIGPGSWLPYTLADWRAVGHAGPYLTPAWISGGSIVRTNNPLQELNNVDIVFTSDKSKWSRCPIVETANEAFAGFTTVLPEGGAMPFDVRQVPSVGKEDADGDGLPDPDGDVDPDGDPRMGMGWFPGYAIDVETGQRLNIFFGENSIYRDELAEEFPGAVRNPTGGDMMYNPTSQVIMEAGGTFSLLNFIAGGQHFVYVTRQPYDEGEALYARLKPASSSLRKVRALQNVTWTSMTLAAPGAEMLSYADGLIPTDLTVKLRVDNPYQVAIGTGEYNGYPTYRFKLEGQEATELVGNQVDSVLSLINIVPNPYYGYSAYETSQFTTTVKITNLPAKATISIFTLDGKFIRQYTRDEAPGVPQGNGIRNKQITPDLEWDMKNSKGIPIASGVYLIHVDADGLGERTIKWFGINRQYDPSGL